MPFRLPTFNITCNVWTDNTLGPYPLVRPARIAGLQCQLRELKTAVIVSTGGGSSGMLLAVPPRSDVRGISNTGGIRYQGDAIEVPAGSGRFYECLYADDVARGFDNEYRTAIIFAMVGIPNAWPSPLT